MNKKPFLILIALGLIWQGWNLLVPVHLPEEGVVVSVPVGAGAGVVARNLAETGAVRSAFAFKLAARLSGRAGQIKAGDYQVPGGMNAFQTVSFLVSGKSLMKRFLVREGLSARQIAALLEEQGLGKADRFMKAVQDPGQAMRLNVPGPTLEGYLFPDTYFFPKGYAEADLAERMVARFHAQVPASLLAKGSAIRLDPRQVMTMASLIEKEAKEEQERPIVSGVFRSRMRQKKRLESCASVRYATNKWTGPLYNHDLLAKSPYNTYQNFGLPPGPICSPGLRSIEAALNPIQTDAMYFVVAGDGSHIFSKTYEQHLAAKARWKKLKKGMVD